MEWVVIFAFIRYDCMTSMVSLFLAATLGFLFKALVFLLVLSVLVLVHELGHFFVAKRLGVKVEEFGFGFPLTPAIFSKKIGETVYSFYPVLIGGFVKLYGEDDAGAGKVKIKNQEVKMKDEKNAFFSRPVWQRASIVIAGVVMNFLLALVILSYLFAVQGVAAPGNQVQVVGVAKNSPAQKAGLAPGDIILTVNGKNISQSQELISITHEHLGQQITLRIKDQKSKIENLTLTPRIKYPADEGAMGVAISQTVIVKKYPWYQAPIIGIKETLAQTYQMITMFVSIWSQIAITRQVPAGVAGPVGIAQLTGEVVNQGLNAVLSLVALLSLNLAVLNILPIPALDGGRLFFILIEGVIRKKVPAKYENYAHAAGMALLLALVAFITFHDLARIFAGQPILPK